MNFKEYPSYKDSGVEWLGKVPEHWQVSSIKHLSSIRTGNKDSIHVEEDGKYPFFLRSKKIEKINSYSFDGEAVLTAGDGDVGEIVHYINGKFDFHQRVYMMSNFKKVQGRFFYYYFYSLFKKVAKDGRAKTTVDSLRKSHFDNFFMTIPELKEQSQIVSFLDSETSRIDNLIAKQEKLIEMLEEHRKSVISHTVTKGLDHNVKMKDSGIEWLGEVPEHWEVRPLRYLGNCQNGINIGAEYFGYGSPFISYGDVYRNPELPTVFDGLVQSTENDKRIYSVQRGDVLFTRTSETIEEIGFSSTCLTDVKDATFAGFVIRFRPKKNTLLPEYSKYYFRNILLRAFFVKEMNLVTRASLSQALLKKLAVPLPSLEEQSQIVSFLNTKTSRIDDLIAKQKELIAKLKDYRTSIIFHAVTGKIDVRDLVA